MLSILHSVQYHTNLPLDQSTVTDRQIPNGKYRKGKNKDNSRQSDQGLPQRICEMEVTIIILNFDLFEPVKPTMSVWVTLHDLWFPSMQRVEMVSEITAEKKWKEMGNDICSGLKPEINDYFQDILDQLYLPVLHDLWFPSLQRVKMVSEIIAQKKWQEMGNDICSDLKPEINDYFQDILDQLYLPVLGCSLREGKKNNHDDGDLFHEKGNADPGVHIEHETHAGGAVFF
ncbi:hypothetical protein MATL_G00242210 [Megalops atlanticus]|uniref:Uncharacterized protein n=1 Tax=Megalops atlanticus TaxID=7932 RepID=A0A9D3T1F5_MEGAT|nr:hypothetical protein MATL_G00242210 [Megalops atlanticus]